MYTHIYIYFRISDLHRNTMELEKPISLLKGNIYVDKFLSEKSKKSKTPKNTSLNFLI